MQFPSRSPQRSSRALLRLSAAAAMIAAASGAHAAGDISGYLVYGAGSPVHSGGTCVHTLEWQPSMRLGDCEPPAPKPVAAVQPAPKAEPAPVVEAPRPAPQAVPFRLSLDTLFDYDSTLLKPEGSAALDRLADQIANSNYQSVTITGHADPLGTPSYNQALSERRAQVIAAYLATRGVDAAKVSASGAGSTEAAITLADCKARRHAALVECLQPDRFAEVAVTGTVQQAATSAGDTQ